MTASQTVKPLMLGLKPLVVAQQNEPELELRALNLVIRPLLNHCIAAYVYGLAKDAELYIANADILLADKGKYRLDTSKECIKGHEPLWNKTRWARGSIVIICKPGDVDFDALFKGCFYVGISGTPNMGNSAGATKLCRKEIDAGNVSFCFSASNGIAWMDLYSDSALRESLY